MLRLPRLKTQNMLLIYMMWDSRLLRNCVWTASHARRVDNPMNLDGEGTQDPCQHNVVQPSPIGGCVHDVGEEVIVEGIVVEREEHEVTPPLVVG
jgi:hypothetical protein